MNSIQSQAFVKHPVEGDACVLRWNSVDEGRTSTAPVIDGITFGVSGMLDRSVLFEPKPQLPAELGALGTTAVRVNLRGTIAASARADIPIRFGGIGLSAEGRGATILDWYVARGEDTFVASTIAAAIDALTKTHPFDIDTLSRAFELGQTALFRLLRIRQPTDAAPADHFTEDDRRAIYETSADAMVAGLKTTGSSTDYNNMKHYLRSNGHDEDLTVVLREMRSRPEKYRLHPSQAGSEFYDRLARMVKRANGLVVALEEMRRIYFSGPGPEWTIKDYHNSQEKIDEAIVFWARGEPMDRGWWAFWFAKDSIGPHMLAFFKAIADLSADSNVTSPGPSLLASIAVPHRGREQEIMLTAAGSRPLPSPAPVATVPAPLPRRRPSSMPLEPPPVRQRGSDNDLPRNHQMPARPTFPMERKIASYHAGGRRYRARRPGGRLHAGCDLIAAPGTKILAMADGEVVKGPYPFYSGTYALEVMHEILGADGKPQTILARYGEINQMVPKGVSLGNPITQGQLIATVGQLKSGNSMLHLEMYSDGNSRGKLTVGGINKFKRRGDVMDPTPILDAAEVFGQASGMVPAMAFKKSKDKKKTWSGIVDPLKVRKMLNVRATPRIVSGAQPLFRLAPNTEVEIIGDQTGGAYPFGYGNLWFKIRHEERIGFAVAYFVDTDYPIAGSKGLEMADAEVGYVSRLEGGLRLRARPSLDAAERARLPKGTRVAILSQHSGGAYDSDRNDWLRVIPDKPESVKGYVAGYYIDIGEKVDHDVAGFVGSGSLNDWERILLQSAWEGASDQTVSGQLGRGIPSGVAASERLAEQDLERVSGIAGVFADVAAKFGLPAALLAAIASRESRCGKALDNGGWGDYGNGFGIMQVDKNAHRIRNTSDPFGIDHVEQATGILAANLEGMVKRNNGWRRSSLLQGAVAAYNFGLGNVQTETGIDVGTTGDDYGSDVLARARYYFEHPRLHLFRP